MFHLIVKHAFADYQKGDSITDQAEIERILASAHAHHVVKIIAPAAISPPVTPVEQSAPIIDTIVERPHAQFPEPV